MKFLTILATVWVAIAGPISAFPSLVDLINSEKPLKLSDSPSLKNAIQSGANLEQITNSIRSLASVGMNASKNGADGVSNRGSSMTNSVTSSINNGFVSSLVSRAVAIIKVYVSQIRFYIGTFASYIRSSIGLGE